MKKYIKRLNWFGASIVFFTCCAGAASNTNVNSIIEWAFLVIIFGIPFSLMFLFLGIEPK